MVHSRHRAGTCRTPHLAEEGGIVDESQQSVVGPGRERSLIPVGPVEVPIDAHSGVFHASSSTSRIPKGSLQRGRTACPRSRRPWSAGKAIRVWSHDCLVTRLSGHTTGLLTAPESQTAIRAYPKRWSFCRLPDGSNSRQIFTLELVHLGGRGGNATGAGAEVSVDCYGSAD